MRTPVEQISPTLGPSTSWGESAEQNYIELAMTIRHTQGMFALLPVRSNYSVQARDALLRRLADDIGDIPLRILQLNREAWDPGPMIADVVDTLDRRGAVVLLGLEDTPGIVPAVGEENRRPPALAILNHAREAIRSRCRYPLVVWCEPLTYRALREHAPDFFDYFTGLFAFEGPKDVEAKGGRVIDLKMSSDLNLSAEVPSILKAGSPAAISFYEDRLAKSQEPTPERARDLLGLAENLWALPDPDVNARLERAENTVSEALSIVSKDDFPNEWARGHSILGRICTLKPRGNRRENLCRAITCFEEALQVYTETAFPVQWADTQKRLGIAHADLRAGNLTENLLRAIACFEAALRVYTEVDFPSQWAGAQNNRGVAYRDLPTGDRGENLRRAIACYEAALRVYTEADYPRDWAMTEINLGVAYAELSAGDRGENLRRAIACFEAALRVFTGADFPSLWATTLNNLGIAYAELPAGDRGENLRRAIACYEAALRVQTEADLPTDWARTQNNLGIAYAGLPTGDREENLRRAIACYEAALRVRTESDFPLQWAMTQDNLGTAYAGLPTGDRRENLRRAAACYEAALRVYTEQGDSSRPLATRQALDSVTGELAWLEGFGRFT